MDAHSLPNDTWGLALVVLLLGIRHGFDADHLAAIDSLTRLDRDPRSRRARAAGALFSIGHGMVVIPIAVAASLMSQAIRLPAWLASLGAWTSIALLTALALLNVASVIRAPVHEHARLVGWRSNLFAPLLRISRGWSALGVGALFAVSFDTVSQALLFALLASRYGGWPVALACAALFVIGMLLTDGLNGLWLARLLSRADHRARFASRVLALTVAAVGLLTAGLGALTQLSPGFESWSDGKEGWFSLMIVAVIALAFLLGTLLAGRSRVATAEHQAIAPSP